MGHPLMYEDKVVQAEIDLRNQQLSQKNQRINELGEQLIQAKEALDDIAKVAKCGLEIGFAMDALEHIRKVAETGKLEDEE